MRIGLTYDLKEDYLAIGFTAEDAAEFDKMATIDAIDSALQSQGHVTERIGHVHSLTQRLVRGETWDLVFNIAEGVFGFARESQVPAILDAYGVPYTFSDAMVLALALHKGMAKHVAMSQGVPTPAFRLVSDPLEADLVDLPFPLFCKPVAEGTSKGISDRSLVHTRQELAQVCSRLLSKFRQPVLVEEYLPGREFTVGILGTGPQARTLGAMEVRPLTAGEQASYSFENKQNYYDRVTYALAKDEAAINASAVALDAWRALGCRDGGRVDIRLNAKGEANFIEVNPLAGLHPVDSDLVILCRLLGISYAELIFHIVESAKLRIRTEPQAPKIWFGQADSSHTTSATVTADPNPDSVPAPAADATSRGLMLILHGEIPTDAPPDEQDVLQEARFAAHMGRELGFDTITLPFITDITGMRERLVSLAPTVVFNLVETIAGTGRIIELCPSLLEQLNLPFTGNSTTATFSTTNKLLAKKMMRAAGIVTAPWLEEHEALHLRPPFEGPYVIKSLWEHASVGLGQDSIVADPAQLPEFVRQQKQRLGGALFVEQFIDGREFNLSILASPTGPKLLPPAEIRFLGFPNSHYRIVDYKAKWLDDSIESRTTVRSFEFEEQDAPLLGRLRDLALSCWDLFGLSGYARVDFRVAPDGTPYVLEVNTNPCLSPDAGFMAAAEEAGFAPVEVVQRILLDALNKTR